MIIRYDAEGEISGVFPEPPENIPEGHATVEVELDEDAARRMMEEPDRFAQIVGMSPAELASDLSRRRKRRTQDMADAALDEIHSLFRTSYPNYEVLGIHNARLIGVDEDFPPRYTAAMELIRDTNEKLERKLYEVATAEEPEGVTWN